MRLGSEDAEPSEIHLWTTCGTNPQRQWCLERLKRFGE